VIGRRAVAPALALALAAAGCGGSHSMSAQQLRSRAAQACTVATQRLDRIPAPTLPSQGAAFLRRGAAALRPELAALHALHPEGDLGERFGQARTATEQELTALESSLQGLKAGNDPVVTIKTLQAQLVPLQKRASAAWLALKIAACVDT
jgi:hypothetical protein